MNVATGVFSTADQAKDTFNALRRAGFDGGSIGVVTCDDEKARALASTLGREYRPDVTPDTMMADAVYCRFSEEYTETIRRSNLPDDAVDWYRERLDRGDILVIVQVGDRMEEADRIIREYRGMLYGEEAARERRAGRPETRAAEATRNTIHVPIVEEEVYLEKTSHQTGDVEVTTETTSRRVDVPATVMHEEIRVEHRRLDRPMSMDEYQAKVRTESGTVRMPVVEEELRVMKKPVIREEVVITRVPVQESRTVHEEVRHTEPHVKTHGEVHVEETGEERKHRPAA